VATVHEWSGLEARALRRALRLSVRAFAEHLGVAVRTVSKWEQLGADVQPRPDTEAILDTALARADAATHLRFEALLFEVGGPGRARRITAAGRRVWDYETWTDDLDRVVVALSRQNFTSAANLLGRWLTRHAPLELDDRGLYLFARSTALLGDLQRDQGAVTGPVSAQPSYARARSIFTQLDIPRRIAQLDLSLAVVSEMSGLLDHAACQYEALALDERLSRRDRARALLWVGTALSKRGDHDHAVRVIPAAIREFEDLDEPRGLVGRPPETRARLPRRRGACQGGPLHQHRPGHRRGRLADATGAAGCRARPRAALRPGHPRRWAGGPRPSRRPGRPARHESPVAQHRGHPVECEWAIGSRQGRQEERPVKDDYRRAVTECQWREAKVIWDYHQMRHEARPCDAAIGLGSHDLGVAGAAARLYGAGLFPTVVFTGGNSPTTAARFPRGEAVHYREHAIELGIPEEAILVEPNAGNTGQNITFSRDVLNQAGITATSVLLISKPYMERRAFATSRRLWPEVQAVCASEPLELDDYVKAIGEERLVIDMLVGDLQRVIEYPKLGFAIEQEIPEEVHAAYESLLRAGFDSRLLVR